MVGEGCRSQGVGGVVSVGGEGPVRPPGLVFTLISGAPLKRAEPSAITLLHEPDLTGRSRQLDTETSR